MSSDAETLKQAIGALYSATSSEQQRGQANQWLISFANTPQAWEAARALLAEADPNVQYFGANMFFLKVRSEWHGMSEEAKASVYSGLQQLVWQLAQGGARWHRLSPAGKRLCADCLPSYGHLTAS